MPYLKSLSIQSVRNIQSINLEPCSGINAIVGPNGVGKTSILEAVHLLSRTRSFRTSRVDNIIRQSDELMVIFGLFKDEQTIGFQRYRGKGHQIKFSDSERPTSVDTAKYCPVILVNSDSFKMLEAGSEYRRTLLDWLVFHVEPSFSSVWSRFTRILKQRNSALKQRLTVSECTIWDRELASLAKEIDCLRENVFASYLNYVNEIKQQLIPDLRVSFAYSSGFGPNKAYTECLKQAIHDDLRLGYTKQGPHRADIQIKKNGKKAFELLSRGQQKLLIMSLKIAQGAMIDALQGKKSIYLIDDLQSELDVTAQSALFSLLIDMNVQVFLTGTELSDSIYKLLKNQENGKMFHVEHGGIHKTLAFSQEVNNDHERANV